MADLSKLRFNGTDYNVKDASAPLRKFTNYSKTGNLPITSNDTTQTAIGKLEKAHDTNQTNILLVQDATEELVDDGAKNLFDDNNITELERLSQSGNVYAATVNDTANKFNLMGYQATPSAVVDRSIYTPDIDTNGVVFGVFTKDPSATLLIIGHSGARINNDIRFDISSLVNGEQYVLAINITQYNPQNTLQFKDVMICTKSKFDISPAYEPHALGNQYLTPALIECVDEGTKNIFDITTPDSLRDTTVTPLENGGAKLSCNNATRTQYHKSISTKTGEKYKVAVYIDSITGSIGSDLGIYVKRENAQDDDPYFELHPTSTGVYTADLTALTSVTTISIYINNSGTSKTLDVNMRVMVCSEADWKVSQNYAPYALPNTDLTRMMTPFFTVPINHNMIYRGQNLGDTLTADQDTALSSGNFTDLYLGDYWTKSVTIPDFYELTTAEPSDWATAYTSYYTKSGDTYTAVTGSSAPTWAADTYYQKSVPTQTVTLKAVIADFDTFYAGYASTYAGINTHHAAVIVTGFSNVVWNKTNSTAGGYVNSLIHKWLVSSVLPEIETWFGSAKVLSHQKLLTNAITGDAASGWAWSSQQISLLSECQLYGMKVWGGSKATNGAYEPGEAFKKLDVFNHIDANLLFDNRNIWCRDIASAAWAALLNHFGSAGIDGASTTWIAPAALILLS